MALNHSFLIVQARFNLAHGLEPQLAPIRARGPAARQKTFRSVSRKKLCRNVGRRVIRGGLDAGFPAPLRNLQARYELVAPLGAPHPVLLLQLLGEWRVDPRSRRFARRIRRAPELVKARPELVSSLLNAR